MKNLFHQVIGSLTALALIWQLGFPVLAQERRGAGNVRVKNDATGKIENLRLYTGSFALVIGVSDYTKGWQKLPGVATDVTAVAAELERHDFTVTQVLNPNRSKLRSEIETFIENHGYEANNRLLIYYAGHGDTGKTVDGRDLGYIIPADAPLRAKDEAGFRRNAISMDEIEGYARRIEAKHALFVFDSCFSGSLLTARRSGVPPAITYKSTQPVRQFITAGTDEQEVPDKSIFREQFINGLQGEADQNRDEYVTVSELADFLQTKVTNYTRGSQTPQYGKIFDGRLDKGDFVFINQKITATTAANNPAPPETTVTAREAAAVELEAWNLTRASQSAADYRAFLEEFPGGKYAAQARIRLEQTAWEAVKNAADKTQIQKYLAEFPQGANASLARLKIRQLEAAANDKPAPTPTNQPAITASGAERKAGELSQSKLPNNAEMSFAYIPAGEFQMGSTNGGDSEKPVHKVKISREFWMQTTEVTQGQWQAVMGNNPSHFSNCGSTSPVENVSWDDAQKFVAKLNGQNDGYKYRLPTEAEWEYAARAGTTGEYAGNLDAVAWHPANSDGKTHEVGTKQSNGFGLYDMLGNVWEWCGDRYNKNYYRKSPSVDPQGASSGSDRVNRGGDWNTGTYVLPLTFRNYPMASRSDNGLGFRVIKITP